MPDLVTVISSMAGSGILCAALVFLTKTLISERIRSSIKSEYDIKLESFKSNLQRDFEVFKYKIENERRVSDLRFEHTSNLLKQLGSILETIQNIKTALFNNQPTQEYWENLYPALIQIGNYYVANRVPYFETFSKEMNQLQEAANSITAELDSSIKENRRFQIDLNDLFSSINSLRSSIVLYQERL